MSEISLEQIGRLRDELLRLRIFQDQQDRRRLITFLPFASSIPQDNRPGRETEAIIEKCSERDGFAALLDVLAQLTSEPLDDFIAELDRIQSAPIVTWAELQELKANLRNEALPSDEKSAAVLRDTVKALRLRGIYVPAPENCAYAQRFLCHINYLARLISMDPLFDYLERCRPILSTDVAEILFEWRRKLCGRLGATVSETSVDAFAASAITTYDPAMLQIKFAPTPATEGIRYEIKAWLFRGSNFDEFHPVAKELTDASSSRTFGRANLFAQVRFLRRTFCDIVLETLDLLDAAGDLLIEVILPNYLLNSRIDLWRIPFGMAEKRAIALQYPIVVRSLERLYSPPYRPTRRGWIEKWRKLPAALQPSQVTWAEASGAYQATLFDELEKSSLTFVGLTLVPKFDV